MPTYTAVLSAAGPEGLFATVQADRLIIRDAETKTLLRNIELDAKFVANVRHMRWYKEESQCSVQRLLLATHENVQIYDVRSPRWQASIRKVCGDGVKVASIRFGAHEDEIIAFSAFGLKAYVWSLVTGSAVEIRDPKAHSLRTSGHLAILTRSGTKDIVTVLAPERKEVESFFVAATADAQGVKWSLDGRWIAVWDTPTAGTGVAIYTATGQLFKRFGAGGEDLSYGVQDVQWHAKSLIVLMNDGKAVFLNVLFQPHMVLEYPVKVSMQAYEEHVADGVRSYSRIQHPISPPTSESLGFNFATASEDMFACVSARLPTTVWVHTLTDPRLAVVLVHHGDVRSLKWHKKGLLLIHCSANKGEDRVYLWGPELEPQVLPALSRSPLTRTAWLQVEEPTVLVSTASTCIVVAVLKDEEDDPEVPTPKASPQQRQRFNVEATPTPMLGYEMETPIAAMSSFSPVKMDTAQLTKTLGFQFTSLSDTEDTFNYKRSFASSG